MGGDWGRIVAEIKLEAVERAFARWRRAKKSPSEPVPEGLWDQALAAAQVHGRSRTAKRLGLNHSILKSRVEQASLGARTPEFVELPLANLLAGPTREATFELADDAGRRLLVTLPGLTPHEVAAIACQLWGAGQ